MTSPAYRKLRLSTETIARLQSLPLEKPHPAATTLSACRGGCKANTGICGL
jgi:hypothetical protein